MLLLALLGAGQCRENHSELAQTAWQASYTHM